MLSNLPAVLQLLSGKTRTKLQNLSRFITSALKLAGLVDVGARLLTWTALPSTCSLRCSPLVSRRSLLIQLRGLRRGNHCDSAHGDVSQTDALDDTVPLCAFCLGRHSAASFIKRGGGRSVLHPGVCLDPPVGPALLLREADSLCPLSHRCRPYEDCCGSRCCVRALSIQRLWYFW